MTRARYRHRAVLLGALLLAVLAADAVLLRQRGRDRAELVRLRADMTALERQRADAILAADAAKAAVLLELLRRRAQRDDALHLAVNTDSGFVALERGPDRLRVMPARIGPSRRVGVPPDTLPIAVPRGMRTIERILVAGDRYALPEWLWGDRGVPRPAPAAPLRWAGPIAVVTTGGTLLYAVPDDGPLAEHRYVMPGAVQLAADDLRAIRSSLRPGLRVYFF